MLIVGPSTTSALARRAGDIAWVMFVQVTAPNTPSGPIKIEGTRSSTIGRRLAALAADNPYNPMLIGLVETPSPDELALALGEQHAAARVRADWYEPTADLLAYIQHAGQPAIQQLLGQTHPAGIEGAVVDIDEMARLLDCSVPTVRRMVKAAQIPFIRRGPLYRFVPADVIASLQRR